MLAICMQLAKCPPRGWGKMQGSRLHQSDAHLYAVPYEGVYIAACFDPSSSGIWLNGTSTSGSDRHSDESGSELHEWEQFVLLALGHETIHQWQVYSISGQ